MKDLIKISVDQTYRSKNGWFVECSDGIERFVHEDDLLAHLGADAKGMIERDALSIGDERTEFITLAEWLADNAGLPLEIELAILINKREDRVINAPLPDGFEALNGIAHLVKSAA